MKKVLGLIGVGIIASTAAYMLVSKKADKRDSEKRNQSIKRGSGLFGAKTKVTEGNGDFNKIKAESINKITSRHEKAAQEMRTAVDNIFSRRQRSEEDSRELELISDELDILLEEM